MTTFENEIIIQKPIADVYAFLKDLRNHEQLMGNAVEGWSATEDEATFTIKNMAKLTLVIDRKEENKEVHAIPKDKAPFKIDFTWFVQENATNVTTAKFQINADLNMMMKMIASGPLQKMVDLQVRQLGSILNA